MARAYRRGCSASAERTQRLARYLREDSAFASTIRGHTNAMSFAYGIAGVIAAIGAIAYIGLLIWGAREDGRDQERRDNRV